MSAYNPILLGKILDRAGHPATPEHEALIAIRKAYSHCTAHGASLGEAVQFINGDIFIEAAHMPHTDLLAEIADLTLARDEAEARLVAQDKLIAECATAAAGAAATIDELRAEVAALRDTLVIQTPTASARPVASEIFVPMPTPVDGADINSLAREPIEDESDATVTYSEWPPAGDQRPSETEATLSGLERFRLIMLASLGRRHGSIARTLSREFGRVISAASVSAVLRDRWQSSVYRRRVDGMARLTRVARAFGASDGIRAMPVWA